MVVRVLGDQAAGGSGSADHPPVCIHTCLAYIGIPRCFGHMTASTHGRFALCHAAGVADHQRSGS